MSDAAPAPAAAATPASPVKLPEIENSNLWRGILSVIIVVAMITLAALLITHVATDGPSIQTIVEVIRDGFMLVVGYYFGSSAGSTAKNAILAQQALTPTQGNTP